jgi:hypothetical protein
MATVKKTSRTTKTKQSSKKPSGRSMGPTLLKSLPESVEHIEIVQQVAGVLAELQNRVIDVKEEASKELKKLMKRYETHYQGLEKKVHKVTLDAKKQAQTSMIHILQKWHEHKEKLPSPLAKEIEKIIDQIGAKMVKPASSSKKSPRAAAKKPASKAAPKKAVAPRKPSSKIKARSKATVTPEA